MDALSCPGVVISRESALVLCRGVTQIKQSRGCIEKSRALFQEIHANDSIDRSSRAVPEGIPDGTKGSHRDLKFAHKQSAEEEITYKCAPDGGAITGSINDL